MDGFRAEDAKSVNMQLFDAPAGLDRSAQALHIVGDVFPELSRAKFRIHELLDQGGLGLLLRDINHGRLRKRDPEAVRDGFYNGQSLYALRSPFRTDLIAGNSPDLFGIALEERQIEFTAESVDQKLFECFLGLFLL